MNREPCPVPACGKIESCDHEADRELAADYKPIADRKRTPVQTPKAVKQPSKSPVKSKPTKTR